MKYTLTVILPNDFDGHSRVIQSWPLEKGSVLNIKQGIGDNNINHIIFHDKYGALTVLPGDLVRRCIFQFQEEEE